jgi:hypothetical protein
MVIVAFLMAALCGLIGYAIGYAVAEEMALEEYFGNGVFYVGVEGE